MSKGMFRHHLALKAGKAAAVATRLSRRGGGTALPGLIALSVAPDVVARLSRQLKGGLIVVSGTNGKTTTCRILDTLLSRAGWLPIRNTAGSNMMRGITSSLIARTGFLGRMPPGESLVGLFEVDEAALPGVLEAVDARQVLLLDLFRDQLDRYGEVATVARLWRDALKRLGPTTLLVANADDPLVANVALESGLPTCFFGIEVAPLPGVPGHAGDVKACPRCGSEISYMSVVFGHLGAYACTKCDFSRPALEVCARNIDDAGMSGSSFTLRAGKTESNVSLPLPGLYNVYNALGAAAIAAARGMPADGIARSLEMVTPAFGRMECLDIRGRSVYLALAKNPAGLNEVLRTVLHGGEPLHLLAMLNDKTADGHDVSWIWDSDVEMLAQHVESVVFSGTRAEDIALRFKYALALPADDSWWIDRDSRKAFEIALSSTPHGGTLYIVPTYTAMLDVRGVLARLGHVKTYWEG
ncbi:MAG: MurT ligase domain-containing protein [Chloroflexota bacterium]